MPNIRLANPRTEETADQLLLRRGFSFSRGFDGSGQLDQGLAFVSYQASLERQFLPVQERLAGEPLESTSSPSAAGSSTPSPGAQEGRPLAHGSSSEAAALPDEPIARRGRARPRAVTTSRSGA